MYIHYSHDSPLPMQLDKWCWRNRQYCNWYCCHSTL